jgi:ubiquitin C-terminal hydrolase
LNLAACSLEKQYLLECYLKVLSWRKSYMYPDLAKLAEILIASVDDLPLSSLLITLLSKFPVQSFVQQSNSLLRCCLNFVINPSFPTRATAVNFLVQLVQAFPETTVFEEDLDRTEQLVLSATDQTWPQIKVCLTSVTAPLRIFQRVSARLHENSIYFVEIFAALLPVVGNSIDKNALFAKGIEMIQSQGKLLLPGCEIAMSILNSGPLSLDSPSEIVLAILRIVFHSRESLPPFGLFKLCRLIADAQPDVEQTITNDLTNEFAVFVNGWFYNPSQFARTSNVPFTGLRNLGATCYMNASLQQLFHCASFRNSILMGQFDTVFLNRFQALFLELSFSPKTCADPRPFCDVWTGATSTPINVHEQEDAQEFLLFFLGKLPTDCTKSLHGTVIHRIRGIGTSYDSSSEEGFFFLSMDVAECGDLKKSFKLFLHDEMFTDTNRLEIDGLGKLNAWKSTRIRALPDVLIFHLKRFGYDRKRCTRFKISSRFEFPDDIDVTELLETPGDPAAYHLKGVVLHSGSAHSGHYVSLVRIDEQWYRFDDTRVEIFPKSQFETETFGPSRSHFCAYLLIYEKDGLITKPIPDLRDRIADTASIFLHDLVLFARETFEFVSHCKSLELIVQYLFGVYAHSNLVCETQAFISRVSGKIADQGLNNWLVSEFERLLPTLLEILRNAPPAVTRTILSIFDSSVTIGASAFRVLDGLLAGVQSANQLCTLAPSLVNYVRFDALEPTDRQKWNSAICAVICQAHDRGQLNFHECFDVLTHLETGKSPLLDDFATIVASQTDCLPFFRFLILTKQLPISQMVPFLPRLSDEAFLDFVALVLSETDFDLSSALDQRDEFRDRWIIQFVKRIRSGDDRLRRGLIRHFAALICPFLIISFAIGDFAEHLTAELFPHAVPPVFTVRDLPGEFAGHRGDPSASTGPFPEMVPLVEQFLAFGPRLISVLDAEYAQLSQTWSSATLFFNVFGWAVARSGYARPPAVRFAADICRMIATHRRENDAHVPLVIRFILAFPFHKAPDVPPDDAAAFVQAAALAPDNFDRLFQHFMRFFTDFALFREFFAHLELLPGRSVAALAEAFGGALGAPECVTLCQCALRPDGDPLAALLPQLLAGRGDAAAVADAVCAAGAIPALLGRARSQRRLAIALAERSAAARAIALPRLELAELLRFLRAGDAEAEEAMTGALRRFCENGAREDCADALREFVQEELPEWLWAAAVQLLFANERLRDGSILAVAAVIVQRASEGQIRALVAEQRAAGASEVLALALVAQERPELACEGGAE